MKPLVPVNDRAYLQRYAQAGGEEFYLGFHDDAWRDRFGEAADLNRMTGFGRTANPYTFDEALAIVEEVRALGKRAYVTFNANAYAQEQLDFLFGYFERLHEAGAAGVIVSVPEAVQAAADCGLAVVASTMCGVYNADIARFYRRLGCTRVIIPRDVSLDEIEAIVRAVPGVEYEAFVMRNGCVFADGLCLGRHIEGRNALCWDVRHARREHYVAGPGAAELDRALCENAQAYERFHHTACGLCALYRLMRAGVSTPSRRPLRRLGVHPARHRGRRAQRGHRPDVRKRAGVSRAHARPARARPRLRRRPRLLLPRSAVSGWGIGGDGVLVGFEARERVSALILDGEYHDAVLRLIDAIVDAIPVAVQHATSERRSCRVVSGVVGLAQFRGCFEQAQIVIDMVERALGGECGERVECLVGQDDFKGRFLVACFRHGELPSERGHRNAHLQAIACARPARLRGLA